MSERQLDSSPPERPAPSTSDPATTKRANGPIIIDGRYITDHYPGIGRYVFSLARALATVAPEQRFSLLIDRGERQTRFDFHALESCGVALVPIGIGPRSLRGRFGVRRMCRHLSPALFHAPHILSAVRLSCPSIVTIHDLIPMQGLGALPSLRHRLLYRGLLRRALASATCVITPSWTVGRDLQAHWGVSPERITVVPDAADSSFRPALQEQIAAARRRLGLPERYVLCVGTNRPHKNLSRLVEAWAGLADGRRNGCRLVIAGPEDTRYPEARRQAEVLDSGAVLFVGKVDEADLAAVYSGAQLVVQPSLHEGFGLPVIEAMACGVPVACSRTPALDEVSGGAALQFNPTSVHEMSTAMDRLLNEEGLHAQLIPRGLRRASEFSWARTAEMTLGAYREAGRQHGAGRP